MTPQCPRINKLHGQGDRTINPTPALTKRDDHMPTEETQVRGIIVRGCGVVNRAVKEPADHQANGKWLPNAAGCSPEKRTSAATSGRVHAPGHNRSGSGTGDETR